MLATAPARDVKINYAVYRRDGYDYWQQLPDGSITLGGFRDINTEGEWEATCEPANPIQDKLEDFLRNYIGTKAPITHRWAGLVSYTKNGNPISEEVRPGVFAIGAYNGTGNIVGLLYGKKAATWA